VSKPALSAPVALHGTGAEDDQEIERLFSRLLALDFLDTSLGLSINYSGDVTFEIKARFTGGVLRTVDHSLSKRRHMVYGER